MANGDPEIVGLSKVYVPGEDPNYAAPMLVLSEAEAQKYAAWLNDYNEKMGRPVVKFSVPERADLFGEALAERDAEIAALKAKLRDRTRDLITWIQIAVVPSDPITVVLAARRKIEELEKELDE